MTTTQVRPYPPGWDDERFRELDRLHAEQVRMVGPFGDGETIWVAHDYPERPLEFGAWVCCCPSCHAAIRATARIRPRTALVLKFAVAPRLTISVVEATIVLDEWGCLEVLAEDRDDHVREIFVARGRARSTRRAAS